MLLLQSTLENKFFLSNWSIIDLINNYILSKNMATLTLFRQLISLKTDDDRCEYNFTHIWYLKKLCASGVWTQIETNTFFKYQT